MGIDLSALKQAYYEKLGKGKPTPAESIGKIGEAYKKAGGGLKGIGMGALQSIGSIAEMMNTPEGLKIAGYVSNNPYYLPQAEHLERAEMGKQHSIGELVKQDELLEGQKDIAKENRAMELEDIERKEKYRIGEVAGTREYEEAQKAKEQELGTKQKSIAEMKQSIDQDKTLSLEEKLAAKAMIDRGETPQFEQKGAGIPFISPKKTILKMSITPEQAKAELQRRKRGK